jgi:hypothetical protein
VTESDTQYYGVGALLLAATAVADLKLARSIHRGTTRVEC